MDRGDYIGHMLTKAIDAAVTASVKFPQPNKVLLKVAEEAGEVVKAGVHISEGRGQDEDLENEIIQTIAMLIRLMVEGDPTIGLPSTYEGRFNGT